MRKFKMVLTFLGVALFVILFPVLVHAEGSTEGTINTDIVYQGIPVVALIIGIGQIIKKTGFKSKFIPIINLIFGLIFGILLNLNDPVQGVILGVVIGLAASGLFSSSKNVYQGFIKQT